MPMGARVEGMTPEPYLPSCVPSPLSPPPTRSHQASPEPNSPERKPADHDVAAFTRMEVHAPCAVVVYRMEEYTPWALHLVYPPGPMVLTSTILCQATWRKEKDGLNKDLEALNKELKVDLVPSSLHSPPPRNHSHDLGKVPPWVKTPPPPWAPGGRVGRDELGRGHTQKY